RPHRVSDIATALFVLRELHGLASPVVASSPEPAARRWRWVAPAAIATVITAAGLGATWWSLRPRPSVPPVAQFSLPLPEGQFFSNNSRQIVGVSPDGTKVAYVANQRIYLRALREIEAHAIPGTENTAQGVYN